jgi:hypothetical protein
MTRARDTANTQENIGGSVAPIVGAKNIVINGGIDFWQRGTTFTGFNPGAYSADRWGITSSGTGINTTVTQDTSTPNASIKYAIKYQQVSGASSGVGEWRARQFIEVGSIRPLQGKFITTSFWYKSNLTGNHAIRVGIFQATGSGLDSLQSFSYPTANVWQYVSVTHSCLVGTTGWSVAENQAGAFLDVGPSQTSYAANDYFEFTNMQLESGSVATPFSRAGGTYQGELAACQRYYYRTSPTASGSPVTTNGGIITTTIAQVYVPLPVTMRANPSAMEYSAINWYNYGNNTEYNTGTFALTAATPNLASVRYTHGTAIFTAGQVGAFTTAGSSSYLGFTAEL